MVLDVGDYRSELTATATYETSSKELRGDVRFKDLVPSAFAKGYPGLEILTTFDDPLNGSIQATLADAVHLQSAEIDIDGKHGSISAIVSDVSDDFSSFIDAVARQRVARPQEELKPALSEQDTEAAGESKSFQILSVGRAPELGRDHEVITATRTWSSLFEKSGEEPPVIDFTKQRAVLLHEALGSEPPARLSIETIAVQAGMLVITCRVERLEGSADATLAPGQIVLVPAGELPIRVVILP